jgi:outer membrane protein TolC
MSAARLQPFRLTAIFSLFLFAGTSFGQGPAECPEALPNPLTLPAAVSWALVNHPELSTVRQQHHIAAADVVIARTYPFNPVSENRFQNNNGPESAGITNRVNLEHLLLWEVEVRGQGGYRRQAAAAALSRTDDEIAAREQGVAVGVARAFATLVYRQEKQRLLAESAQLNNQLLDAVRRLQQAGKLTAADMLVAQTEASTATALLNLGAAAIADAEADLHRAMGTIGGPLPLQGALEVKLPPWDVDSLTEEALAVRPELHARQAALQEAEARLRLEMANRHGNPTIGAAYIYDPTRINEIGGQINFPLPVVNLHRGEIQMRDAERARAALDLRQTEMQVRREVQAASARLTAALALAETYRSKVLPDLEKALKGMRELFLQAAPGVDLLRVIDVQRKRIQAQDAYLDALAAVRQALADMAAAVGDPSLAICPPVAP